MKRVVAYKAEDGTLTEVPGNPGHEPGTILRPLVKLPKDADACWPWQGAIDANGYGKKEFNGRTLLAHRWIWQTLFGPIPEGLVVSHECGNLACVNPRHLVAQTQADAIRSGLAALLTIGDVGEIRELWDNGMPAEILSERFCVALGTVRSIVQRKSWRKPKPFHGPNKHRKAA